MIASVAKSHLSRGSSQSQENSGMILQLGEDYFLLRSLKFVIYRGHSHSTVLRVGYQWCHQTER